MNDPTAPRDGMSGWVSVRPSAERIVWRGSTLVRLLTHDSAQDRGPESTLDVWSH